MAEIILDKPFANEKITVTVKITPEYKYRYLIGVFFIRLAMWALGAGKVEFVNEVMEP